MNTLELVEMNTLELVEYLESGYDTHMREAATMLRKQDAAIKQLREALDDIAAYYPNSWFANCVANRILAATEEFK